MSMANFFAARTPSNGTVNVCDMTINVVQQAQIVSAEPAMSASVRRQVSFWRVAVASVRQIG
jgi:hypothetical protein